MEKTLFDIVLILIFTKLGGSISKKFKMPEVLGALTAGVILGPVILNLVQYDENIKLLSNLGVITLMFSAGLETDLEKLKKAGATSSIIAICGIIIPLILGTLCAYMFFDNLTENIFIGVILTATSVSITVETLKEIGKLNTKSGVNILGAAIIDDVLGLILISVVLVVAQSSGTNASSAASSLAPVFIKAASFCTASLLGIIYLPKYINKFTKKIKAGRGILTFSLAFAFFMSFTAESLGIAAITGAYIAGLIISSISYKKYLERNMGSISTGFLSPIFFASVGIEANLKGLNREVIFITLVMFAVAVIGKLLGCGGAARLLKMKKSEALQIGTGMISRGEVAIITANIGLQKNIISEEIFLPTLIVVILTTIVTPVLLKMTFSHKNEELV